jgi:hypothetical protein
MTSLDRRELLLASALGACAPLVWLAEALGFQEPSPAKRKEKRRDLLRAAARRARDEVRPLLVLLLPSDRNARADRGYALARWLTSAEPADRLDLGLVELACAEARGVKAVFGPVPLHHEPSLLWIDVETFEQEGAPAPRVSYFGPALESFASLMQRERRGDAVDCHSPWELHLDHMRRLARALREALSAPERSLEQLSSRVVARLDEASHQRLERWIAEDHFVEPALLRRATALIRARRSALPAERADALEQRLALAVASALGSARIPGSAWARSEGCGTEIEAPVCEEELWVGRVACGIAMVPEQARRFLWFWSE